MRTLRSEEEWARQVMARVLTAAVVQHDDGSVDGMHDLTILYASRPSAAVEVTAAADGETMALWKLLNRPGERWIEESLAGGWTVQFSPTARGRRVRNELPVLLRTLEEAGITHLDRPRWWHEPQGPELVARDLGITWMHQSATDFPGSIYCLVDLPPERCGGFAGLTGDALAEWVGGFLSDERQDVCEKLARSGAGERHAVLILPGFATTDFAVTDLLMRDHAPLPLVDPDLPAEVTHVWAMSTWSGGSGMRWSPDAGWEFFEKWLGSTAPNGDPG